MVRRRSRARRRGREFAAVGDKVGFGIGNRRVVNTQHPFEVVVRDRRRARARLARVRVRQVRRFVGERASLSQVHRHAVQNAGTEC